MTKSVFTIRLSKSVGKDMMPYIEKIIPQESRKMSVRALTFDSASGGGNGDNVIGYIFEFIQNKDVCYSVAAIVIAWIRARNGKGISLRKGDTRVDITGLNEKELYKILDEKAVTVHIDSFDTNKPT
ncbi:hypothetical protein N5923_23255 [Erwiniaceae bacterium BAC15a-03b]|uniref:Uncharacterized protein n=1 Tax=Winslowiella arboricola TaxID=2978220 RepID=A0A9J6PXE9_9GAMM|nr:hypothetical protein [Winslowiella arboricola]MCU5775133.1 hypothetical protein [Winslowiella arboricola]MCU5780413.1 hypothetical protein [Winslowiella arboricola]